MSKGGQRLLIGCAAVVLIGFMAAGTVGVALWFPFADDSTTASLSTDVPLAADAAATTDSSGGQSTEVSSPAAAAPAVPLPFDDDASSGMRDLSALFEAVNPGVVAVHALRDAQFADAEIGADGSGWVFDNQHVVTNHHVVEGSTDLSVTFADGSESAATLVGSDDDADLAVLAITNMPASARALPLVADFDSIKVGEPVVAIGNPFGLNNTITSGIVSALDRIIRSGQGQDAATSYSIPQTIQTDAAINPGNSGGPLLNMRGEVVGINAQIRTNGAAANSGVGFAIPASVAARVVPGLIRDGKYVWSFLGVQGTSVDLRIAEANNLGDHRGAYILGVVPDGPSSGKLAGRDGGGGIVSGGGQFDTITSTPVGGDVVIRVDGEPVTTFEDLLTYVALETRPGDTVKLTVLRDGTEQDVEVTLSERPD